MLSKQFKALTVVLLTMAVATPEMAVPAAAFLPAQVGSGGNSGLKPDSSNLLTEVESDFYWRKYRHGSKNFNGGNYRRHSYNNGWNNNYNNGWNYRRHHRRHHHNNDWPYYALAFGLGYGLGGYGGGYGDGYYGGGGGGHVEWCLNRYRSYNPRTNLFKGYDGYYHQCNSPYD